MASELDDELLALQAIFEDDFGFERISDGGVIGFLSVAMSLPDQIYIQVGGASPDPAINNTKRPSESSTPPDSTPPSATDPNTIATEPVTSEKQMPSALDSLVLPVEHVPPIVIRFRLPPGYPESSGPLISLECSWLSPKRLARLRNRLMGMWMGNVVMYEMSDFVKEDATVFLGLVKYDEPIGVSSLNLKSGECEESGPSLADITDIILDHDRKQSLKIFEQSLVTCGICFDDRKGSFCQRFNGCELKQVACPDEACKKRHANSAGLLTLEEPEILAIVGSQLFQRYKDLRLKQSLEGRQDVTYCPRPMCQSPVIKDASEEKLCICPECRYAFCFFCGRTWHGYAQYCKISKIMEIAKEYQEAPENHRKFLEMRYGRKILEKAVRDLEDERMNAEWLKANAQACPSCSVSVQRSYGCSHMTLCGSTLSESNPYTHYNDKHSPCYNRLFEDNEGRIPDGVDMVPDEDDDDLFGLMN
ncbi:E3 ubiquitin-protein ligase rnf14 [Dinochytrium kinnereticum]|nr:E3 ubiquitin-protein ligase rnf14 [Dinochytrium kinnereticum]